MNDLARDGGHSEFLRRVSFRDMDKSQVGSLGMEDDLLLKVAAFEAAKNASFLRHGCLGLSWMLVGWLARLSYRILEAWTGWGTGFW
jgi:hypothetical protein